MRMFHDTDVYEAAKERIRVILRGCKDFCVNFSGGKDSTVTFHLVRDVAEEMGRLPVKVLFLDQEAEYQAVVDYVRIIMDRPDVTPMWYQIPFKLFNSNSLSDEWLQCWDESKPESWMRAKEHDAITVNDTGVDRFKDLLGAIQLQHFGPDTVFFGGVRCEESPARFLGLTNGEVAFGYTFGKVMSSKLRTYVFYPIYDMGISDVWKAILDNHWGYCEIYDKQHRLGVPIQKMRVSSLCHEVSSTNLQYLQEMEPKTWEKLVKRLGGIATAGNFTQGLQCPDKLPFMFSSWLEYRDYLAENLLVGDSKKLILAKFAFLDARYEGDNKYYGVCINTILANDYFFTKMSMFASSITKQKKMIKASTKSKLKESHATTVA